MIIDPGYWSKGGGGNQLKMQLNPFPGFPWMIPHNMPFSDWQLLIIRCGAGQLSKWAKLWNYGIIGFGWCACSGKAIYITGPPFYFFNICWLLKLFIQLHIFENLFYLYKFYFFRKYYRLFYTFNSCPCL